MFNIIRQLFLLLSDRQLKQFYSWQVLVVIVGFTKLLGIASIAPSMALVGKTHFLYKTTDYYAKERERSIRWDDRNLAIPWPRVDIINISDKNSTAEDFYEQP